MVVAETDENGKEKTYYTRGLELISMENEGEIWYYLYDGHGNVRNLTNEEGRVTDRYTYEAYGTLIENKGDTENEFLYTGEQYNAFSGFYYLRARYMNPATGTFISKDSYQGNIYDPVTLHKYLYAGSNPVKYIDPTGNILVEALTGAGIQTEQNRINAITFNIGMSILRKARAVVTVKNVISCALSYELTKIVYDYYVNYGFDAIHLLADATTLTYSIVWPWEKDDENVVALDIAKKNQEGGNVYYHATSVVNAALIVATKMLISTDREYGHVFAWRYYPTKKALALSGAYNAEIIVKFETNAAFVEDTGIVDPYVKKFCPVKSYFCRPVSIRNIELWPVIS